MPSTANPSSPVMPKTTTNLLEKQLHWKAKEKILVYPELSSYTLCIAYATLPASDGGVGVERFCFIWADGFC